MLPLPRRNRSIFVEKLRQYKRKCFPGKGSGIRLAEEIGTTPQNISNWLSGKRLPTMSQMYRLAKAFGISPLELCGMRIKHTVKPKMIHMTVLQKLLQHCEKDVARDVNPRITRKFLSSVKELICNDLYS